MKTRIQGFVLILLLASLCGCDERLARVDNPFEKKDGNFILYVSNQSYEIKSVDIFIAIDNKPIINEYFKVGNQHNWKEFTLQIQDGSHKIEAVSRKGNVTFSKQFEVTGKNWAVLDFCYGKKEGHTCPKPSLIFKIADQPLSFM